MKPFIWLFACVLILSTTCKSKKVLTDKPKVEEVKSPYAFNFENKKTLGEVLDMAKAQKKLVYLDIGATWCVPCKLMKRDVYTHQETADFFNKNFVSYYVDGEKDEGPDLRVLYNVAGYPTLLILDEKGKEIVRNESALYQNDLIEFAKSALGQ